MLISRIYKIAKKQKSIILTTYMITILIVSSPRSSALILSYPNVDLTNDGSNFVLFAETTGDWYLAVDGAGDINNDGYDDFLVGARYNDEGGKDKGQTYLFYGRSNENWQDFDLSQANASFIGENPDDTSGNQVTGIGDINNDGYDDFSIEAIGNSEAAYWAGQSYVFLGGPTNKWEMDTPISQADASYLREGSNDYAHGLYDVGDVDADGYDDFIVSAYRNNEGGAYAGQIYLILGGPTDKWKMDISLANANASFLGNSYDILGIDAAGIGDVNNDGYADFALGSLQNVCYCSTDIVSLSGPRKIDIIFGRPKNEWQMDQPISNANVTIIGTIDNPIAYEGSFSWITGVGDMNNDNFSDFAIGSYTNDVVGEDSGKVSIFLGRETSNWSRNFNLTDANATYYGENPGSWAGYELVGVGDVNTDGIDDLLVGAPSKLTINWAFPYVQTSAETRGKAYLIYGKDGAWNHINASLSTADIIFESGIGGDAFANKVAEIGDINNDGVNDFAISAVIPNLRPPKELGFVHIILDHNSGDQILNITTSIDTSATITTSTTTTSISSPTSFISTTKTETTSSTKTDTNDSPVLIIPIFIGIFYKAIFTKRKQK